jgi:hypothetical protein
MYAVAYAIIFITDMFLCKSAACKFCTVLLTGTRHILLFYQSLEATQGRPVEAVFSFLGSGLSIWRQPTNYTSRDGWLESRFSTFACIHCRKPVFLGAMCSRALDSALFPELKPS